MRITARITAMTTLAVLAGVAAQGEEPDRAAERRVTVCMEVPDGSVVAPEAQAIATGMFSSIGVTIDWRHRCTPDGILISLSGHDPAHRGPERLGYALPYEGTHIVIFYDRVEQVRRDLRARVLAHVLVHEITHILQGIDRHSGYGVMKACWDAHDYSIMESKLLPFAPEDIHLIYLGLAQRAAQASSRPAANREIANTAITPPSGH